MVNWLINVGCMFCVYRLFVLNSSLTGSWPSRTRIFQKKIKFGNGKEPETERKKWTDSLNWVEQNTCRFCNSRPKTPTEALWSNICDGAPRKMGLPILGTWISTPELTQGAEGTEPQFFKGPAEGARNISAAATHPGQRLEKTPQWFCLHETLGIRTFPWQEP